MMTYLTGENIDFVLDCVLEADQPRDQEDVTSSWENNTARDILLEMELESLEDQSVDATIVQGFKDSRTFKTPLEPFPGDGSLSQTSPILA